MTPVRLSVMTAVSCLGQGLNAHREALMAGRSGLTPCAFETVSLDTYVGEVPGVDAVQLPDHLCSVFDCRNNRLALMGLETDGFADRVREAIGRYGVHRVGVFLGTSTAGILETELAYRRRDPDTGALPADFRYRGAHNAFSVADFTRAYFGLQGEAMVISTACSSSAKVFAAAARQLALGQIDAAVVGGVDTLCLTTLYGFASLGLTSPQACRPFDVDRDGISIGEAAAFVLLERGENAAPAGTPMLLGTGESSDAYHMSSPHPEGLGAQYAMTSALRSAGLTAADIDYINLHGTATPANDAAEGLAVQAVFGDATLCSSTKGATGHTLGAAGALEAIVCALALQDGFVPGSPGTQTIGAEPALAYQLQSTRQTVTTALTNSFGFGGSNCALVLGVAA
ncbi:beta-ketoacyl-[acyl-carrier-protein] synthase family protein [Hydrogenophaga sp. 5NK40-0174]|uniref:beta-ketoacyl-[acyl-carrier-protein] synthase family protein n=1 Tax=Hydrogenophaga sp. 5NK40-0174 TaxID=3127649 RepID=UPI003340DEC2